MKLLHLLLLPCFMMLQASAAELSVGDLVPDCALIDQHGKPFQLSQFKAQAIAITFIFTRCPLPDSCPRMTANFIAVQRALAKDKNWHLLTLSFDPAHDTPAILGAYAKAHTADAHHWTFATGEVVEFGSLFGLKAVVKEGLLDHNLRTVVIDATGRVQHVFKGNEWTAQELAWELRKAMR